MRHNRIPRLSLLFTKHQILLLIYIIASYRFIFFGLLFSPYFSPNCYFENVCTIAGTVLPLLMFFCWIQIIFKDPGKPSPNFQFPKGYSQDRRYCLICRNFKPERCHHCSLCGRCVLQFHVHTALFGSCIGFFNRKYFLQFLFYFAIYCGLNLVISIYYWFLQCRVINGSIDYENYRYEHLLWTVGCSLMILMAGFLFLVQSWAVLKNFTNIQYQKRPKWNKYDMGKLQNLKQILGNNYWLWFLPINIDKSIQGDGMNWPTNPSKND